jgi:hypothetical protein
VLPLHRPYALARRRPYTPSPLCTTAPPALRVIAPSPLHAAALLAMCPWADAPPCYHLIGPVLTPLRDATLLALCPYAAAPTSLRLVWIPYGRMELWKGEEKGKGKRKEGSSWAFPPVPTPCGVEWK